MALLRPPAGALRGADARRRDPSPLPAAGAGALRGSPSGAGLSNRDQVWEVLHQRERSLEDLRQNPKLLDRPASPARYLSVPPAQGWNVPQAAGALEWRYEPKLPAIPRKYMEQEQSPTSYIDMTGWLERRLEGVQAECKAEIANRLGAQEQKERHFKDWMQREHEQLSSGLKQLKTSVDSQLKSNMDSQAAQGVRQSSTLQAQCQKLEMKLHEMEVGFAQTTAQVQGLSQTLQALGAASGGGTGGTGASPQQAAVDALRMGLEREVAARTELSIEATEKIKELHRLVTEANDRYQRDVQSRAVQQPAFDLQQEARFATRAPLESVRDELDALQESLRRTAADCSRRCEEAEAACARRASNVQEVAMSAAKELWEEHLGIAQECKASLSSLQQILDAKDKILSQLQQLQQQQRADDKQENANRHQQVIDAVRNRLRDVEVAFTSERNLRAEVQHATDAQIGRVGAALEKAQAEWVKDTERLSDAVKDVRQQMDAFLDGEEKGWKQRLAESIDAVTRRLEDLENKVAAASSASTGLDARLTELSRTQEVGVKELEARLKRDLTDFDTMQTGKLSQTNFDLRNAVKKALSASTEQTRVEMARIEESAALERSVLKAAIQDTAQHSDTQVGQLQDEMRQLASTMRDDLAQQCSELAAGLRELSRDMSVRDDAVQVHAERLSNDVLTKCVDSMDSMQKEAAAHALETDMRCADLQRALTAARENLIDRIDEVKAGAEAQLTAEVEKTHADIQQEVYQLIDEEKRDRIKADMERVASLQRRLGAIEHNMSRLVEQLRADQEDALLAHHQSVQEELTRDREEVRSRLEDIQREQTQAAMAAKAELERLNVTCERFASECSEAIDRTAADSAKALEAASEQARMDLARVEASAALERSALKVAIQDSVQHTNAEVGRVEEEVQELVSTIQQDLEKRCSELGAEMSKQDDEVRAHAEALCNDVLTKTDTRCTHLQRALSAARDNLLEKINEVKAGLQADLEKLHADMQQEVHQSVDEERRARENADMERMASLQRRFSAIEENTSMLVDQLRKEQGESLTAHRQSVQAELTKDREELQSKLAEIQQEHTQAAAAVKSELERLNTACETFAAECSEAIDRTATNSAKALEESSEQARKELARVEETATQERGVLRAAIEDNALRADAQAGKLQDEMQQLASTAQDVDKRCGELADGVKEMGKEMSMRDDEVRTHAERLVTDATNTFDARCADLDQAVRTAQDNLIGKIDAVQASFQAQLTGELDKRQADMQQEVNKLLEEEKQARTKATESLQGELTRRLEAQEAIHSSSQSAMQAQLLELTRQQRKREDDGAAEMQAQLKSLREEHDAKLQSEVTRASTAEADLRKQIGERATAEQDVQKKLDELGGAQEKMKSEVVDLKAFQEKSADAEAAAVAAAEESSAASKKALEDQESARGRLEEELRDMAAKQTALQKDVEGLKGSQEAQLKSLRDEQEASLQAEVKRASVAEEELRKQVEERAKAEQDSQKKLDDLGGMQAQLKSLRDEQEASLQAELNRASTAEADLRKQMEERAKAEQDVQKKLDELGGTQAQLKSLREEHDAKLQSEVTRASTAEADLRKQIGERATAEQDVQKKLDELGGAQEKMKSEVVDLKAFQEKSADAEAAAVAAAEESSAESKKALEDQESARGRLEEELRAVVTQQTALQKDVDGLKASQESQQKDVEGQKKLDERLTAMEQKQGEAMDAQAQVQTEMVDKVASVHKDVEALSTALGNRDEAFLKLRSKVDGGFTAMNVKLETERWFRVQMDAAADTVSNDFLRMLDTKTSHLEKRVEQIEEKVKD